MLKAILALTLCAVASSQLNDGWTPASISEVSGIALWSTNQLSTLAGFEGDYTIRTPKNVKKHIVQDGTNYKFQLDVVYRDQNGKYSLETCDLFVFNSLTNTKNFVEAPVCSNSPALFSRSWLNWVPVNNDTEEIKKIADLTAEQLTVQLGFLGNHQTTQIYDVEKKSLSYSASYKFTAEYLVHLNEEKKISKICTITVNYQPSANHIYFLGYPPCKISQQTFLSARAGGWTQETAITNEVMSLARWSTGQLSQFTGIDGQHTVMTVRNIQTQLVNGKNFKFDLDVLASNSINKYFFKSCTMFIYKPFNGEPSFSSDPVCGPHPNFQ